MLFPLRESAVGRRLEPAFATIRVGAAEILGVKIICLRLFGGTDISDKMASILRAWRAGIIPSKSFSTQTHLAFNFAQMAFPRSISKPTRLPSGAFDSNGG